MTPVLTSFCLIKGPEPLEKPVIVPLDNAAVQLMTEPLIFEDSTILVESFEQMVWVVKGNEVTVGTGLTFMICVIGIPAHPFAVGVIVIVTVPGVIVELVNSQAGIGLLFPFAGAPVVPGLDTVIQLYVVPATVELRLTACDKVPEHIVCEAFPDATGIGLTVII